VAQAGSGASSSSGVRSKRRHEQQWREEQAAARAAVVSTVLGAWVRLRAQGGGESRIGVGSCARLNRKSGADRRIFI
jgi:hypothetical protein